MDTNKIDELKRIIAASSDIVFFTGAGISTASGIPDFRGSNGLNKVTTKYPMEVMLSHSFFMGEPQEFYNFYRQYMIFPAAKPNIAHLKIAALDNEQHHTSVVTQNIDNLHNLAGSKTVIELHGNVYRNYCMKCHKAYGIEKITGTDGIPRCDCGGIIKPDVVLYEEALDEQSISAAIANIRKADCLIVVGTSLLVYPASSLLNYFHGNNFVIINHDPTGYDRYAKLVINDGIKEVFSQL